MPLLTTELNERIFTDPGWNSTVFMGLHAVCTTSHCTILKITVILYLIQKRSSENRKAKGIDLILISFCTSIVKRGFSSTVEKGVAKVNSRDLDANRGPKKCCRCKANVTEVLVGRLVVLIDVNQNAFLNKLAKFNLHSTFFRAYSVNLHSFPKSVLTHYTSLSNIVLGNVFEVILEGKI